MRCDEQRRAGEEAIETLLAGVVTITEFRTNTIDSVCGISALGVRWVAAIMIVVGSNDDAMVRYGLIFEVEPVATNDEIERVECESELLGHGPGLRHANGVDLFC